MLVKKLNEFLEGELKMLDRSIVATPESRESLESFAKSNQGSMDVLLMQMAMNFGYKLALENVKDKLENK